MENNQLQRAINLSKKTGDRLIVFDTALNESPYVVMGLDEYEKLVIGHSEVRGLTENELLDKINRDIAVWKSDNELGDFGLKTEDNSQYFTESTKYNNEIIEDIENDTSEVEDMYRNDFSSPGLKQMQKSVTKKGSWSIPADRKTAAEEVIGAEEEDRQYLEELPF